jgi:hypothetical protein
MPAPIALTIFLTGLRLIWDWPQANSPSSLWLFALILGFSLFFWDGILGYQPNRAAHVGRLEARC